MPCRGDGHHGHRVLSQGEGGMTQHGTGETAEDRSHQVWTRWDLGFYSECCGNGLYREVTRPDLFFKDLNSCSGANRPQETWHGIHAPPGPQAGAPTLSSQARPLQGHRGTGCSQLAPAWPVGLSPASETQERLLSSYHILWHSESTGERPPESLEESKWQQQRLFFSIFPGPKGPWGSEHHWTVCPWDAGCGLGEAAVSSGVKRDLSSLPRNWTWVAWRRTRSPSHQTSKG